MHPEVKLKVFLQREILFYFRSFTWQQLLINAVNLRDQSIGIVENKLQKEERVIERHR